MFRFGKGIQSYFMVLRLSTGCHIIYAQAEGDNLRAARLVFV